MAMIRTPDQRLRVFISSTIQEMAEERKAAQKAISRLKLIPVLFEMGARPHPPRDLYRAYLEQSHIFIGIYGTSYGWIAPDMDISGLEDEYRLANNKPQLIYVKKTTERDERLKSLLKEIENKANTCYRTFSTSSELEEFIENDLAIILSENYQNNSNGDNYEHQEIKKLNNIPEMRHQLIGREEELAELEFLIQKPNVPLVTITGTGGTGKTFLALQLGHNLKYKFKDGVHFISLATVYDPQLLIPTINDFFGIFDNAKNSTEEMLFRFLQNKNLLLILDNLEQIATAGSILSNIITHCAGVTLLVTSRTPLHIRFEQIYPLQPLSTPSVKELSSVEAINNSAAVEMFLQRARAANPLVRINDDNLKAVAKICNKLDGLPLAIELAASRIKYMTPVALLSRMDHLLDLLTNGHRDLPQRQQTIRAAIEWSFNLLDNETKEIFQKLAVFEGGWSLEAAEAICLNDGSDCLNHMEKLVDMGLLHPLFLTENSEPRFDMLKTVREFALEKFKSSGSYQDIITNFINYYNNYLEQMEEELWKGNNEYYFNLIENERYNISFAFKYCVKNNNYKTAWQIMGNLTQYWQMRGYLTSALQWLEIARIKHSANDVEYLEVIKDIPALIQAKALACASVVRMYSAKLTQSYNDATQALELFRESNNELFISRFTGFRAVIGISLGIFEKPENLNYAFQLAYKNKDVNSVLGLTTIFSEATMAMKDLETSERLFKMGNELLFEIKNENALRFLKLIETNWLIVKGDFLKAENCVDITVKKNHNKREGMYLMWAYLINAIVKVLVGKYEEALSSAEISFEKADMYGDNHLKLCTIQVYGAIALQKNEIDKALYFFYGAKYLLSKTDYRHWASSTYFNAWVEQQFIKQVDPAQIEFAKSNVQEITIEKLMNLIKSEIVTV